MTEQTQDNDPESTITVAICRRVKPGKEQEFETLSAQMSQDAARFPGHLGGTLFRPSSEDDPEYRVVFKFDNEDHLHQWLESPERAHWVEMMEPLLESASPLKTISGLTPWFSLPGRNPVRPPPKYKMAMVSFLAIFPTVTIIFFLFGPYLQQMPLLLRTLLVSSVVILLMTYVLMPNLTRWFAFWLFPDKQRDIR